MKILLIEDEETTSRVIQDVLEKEEYIVKTAKDGEEGLKYTDEFLPDIIILDLNLPDMNGLEICSKIRSNSSIYNNPAIIILTAEADQEVVREGLSTGADDYIKKPFDYFELVLRVKALQRRLEKNIKVVYRYENVVIDRENMAVTEFGKDVEMKRKEIELLIYLIINRGITMSRTKIMKEIWEREYIEGDRVIDVTVRRVKEALPSLEDKIINVRGIGYKLLRESI